MLRLLQRLAAGRQFLRSSDAAVVRDPADIDQRGDDAHGEKRHDRLLGGWLKALFRSRKPTGLGISLRTTLEVAERYRANPAISTFSKPARKPARRRWACRVVPGPWWRARRAH